MNRSLVFRCLDFSSFGLAFGAAVFLCFGSPSARAAGTVVAWGANDAGQCQTPAGLTGVSAVAAGESHSLALRADGTVAAWGFNLSQQTNVPPGLTGVVAIAAGANFSLALRGNGAAVIWGAPYVPPPSATNLTAIAAGWSHCLGLRADGTVISWGTETNVPADLTNVIRIAAGNGQSLALLLDGSVRAWGDDAYGKTEVPPDATNIMAIAAGGDHCLALRKSGTVLAWGRGDFGQTTVPANATNIVAISAGALHSVALRANGTLAAWGDNTFGQTTVNGSQLGFVNVACGGFHSLALQGDGSPVILVPPFNQSVYIAKTAAFQVVAAGNAPLTYSWRHFGTNLPGATNATLILDNAQFADGGPYTVSVANPAGQAQSAPAWLTIITAPPVLAPPPSDVTTNCGETAVFAVGAQGSGPFAYEWRFQDRVVGTNATLTLTNLTAAAEGQYLATVSSPYGSASAPARLTVLREPPLITSAPTATGVQGQNFTYRVTALHSPSAFAALFLPDGLVINTNTGVISGRPQAAGVFGPLITAYNGCNSDSRALVITISAAAPVITSALTAVATEGTPFTYTITASRSPTSFGAQSLPAGLSLDPASGVISGIPSFPGEAAATISASNAFGIGSATLRFTIGNAALTGLSIDNVTYNYSSPYLLDFQFSLRGADDPAQGNPVYVDPRLLAATCLEGDKTISPSETAVLISRGSEKIIKAALVLDFSDSIASFLLGDSNGDGISDAVDSMVRGAQMFARQQAADTQIAVYEFHREDLPPQKVLGLTSDKELVSQAIAGIWTNYVDWWPAGSRCWDALDAAIKDLGETNRDEQHYVIFISDGRDESSTATVKSIITAATNANVKVFGIGFGDELDDAPLKQITTATQGRLYTAATADELGAQFAEITKDARGQYVLRWATLKRDKKAFMPSFKISYQGYTAVSPPNPVWEDTNNPIIDEEATPPTTNYPLVTNFIIGYFNPADYTGAVTAGALRFVADAEVLPTGVTLRSTYTPRYVRQFQMHYRANWPCAPVLQATNPGEMLHNWTLQETNDGAGGHWLLLSSPHPESFTNALPFGAFGNLLTFVFRDVINPSNAFSFFELDNSIYTNTGRQTFTLENTNDFVHAFPLLPHGTPVPWLEAYGLTGDFAALELEDSDGDGAPNWQEYRAGTNPTNAASKFELTAIFLPPDGRTQLTFSTAAHRSYRIESSTNLIDWQTVLEGLRGPAAGDGELTVQDPLPPSAATFYRALVD